MLVKSVLLNRINTTHSESSLQHSVEFTAFDGLKLKRDIVQNIPKTKRLEKAFSMNIIFTLFNVKLHSSEVEINSISLHLCHLFTLSNKAQQFDKVEWRVEATWPNLKYLLRRTSTKQSFSRQ